MHATTLLLPFLGACQLEIWAKRSRDSTDLWSAPACNVTGTLELSLGAARTHDRDRTYSSNVQAQGKTLIKPWQTNELGLGIVAGTVNHPNPRARDWYAYAPISTSFLDDRIVVHTNLGVVREGDSGGRRSLADRWFSIGLRLFSPAFFGSFGW